MNSVERVKTICKERKIAISQLEKDCGFGNGYISQLKKGVFPDDRLFKIAEYLEVDPLYLVSGEEDHSMLTAEVALRAMLQGEKITPVLLEETGVDKKLVQLFKYFSVLNEDQKDTVIAQLQGLAQRQLAQETH